MKEYAKALPHGKIRQLFSNIFFVTGTNIINLDGKDLKHSRNMIIIKNNDKLSLINSVRLSEDGLKELENLGKVENIIRIGSFHGVDDSFYLDRYVAKLWGLSGMKGDNKIDIELTENGEMPFPKCSVIRFENSVYPECILHIAKEGGILITCDSIKNWLESDDFFNEETIAIYESLDMFGKARINKIWLDACKLDYTAFLPLQIFSFRHLLSAHGEPLLNDADTYVNASINKYNHTEITCSF
jgi:hypothetical protein